MARTVEGGDRKRPFARHLERRFGAPGSHYLHVSASRLRILTKVNAAAVKTNIQPTRSTPRWLRLADQSYCLAPAKDLLDELAFDLALLVPGVPRGAAIDRAASVGVVLRHMRRYVPISQLADALLGVVVLVATHSHAICPGDLAGIATAASRSAVPEAFVTIALVGSPWRLSTTRWPM